MKKQPGFRRPTIGALLSTLSSPYHEAISFAIADVAAQHDINTVILAGGSFESPDVILSSRDLLFQVPSPDLFDGLIVATSSLSRYIGEQRFLEFLERFGNIPKISIGGSLPGVPEVVADYSRGMIDMMDHLIEHHAYQRIALVRGPMHHSSSNERMEAYRQSLEKHGIPFDESLIFYGDLNVTFGRAAARMMLDERKIRFDAVLTVNDNVAIGVSQELQASGIAVPDAVAVCGFQGTVEGMFSNPPLTSVSESTYEQGKAAALALLELIHGNTVPQHVVVPTDLFIRRSCGCDTHARTHRDRAPIEVQSGVPQPLDEILLEMLNTARYASMNASIVFSKAMFREILDSYLLELRGYNRGKTIATIIKYMEMPQISEQWPGILAAIGVLVSRPVRTPEKAGPEHDARDRFIQELYEYIAKAQQDLIIEREHMSDRYLSVFRIISNALNASFELNALFGPLVNNFRIKNFALVTYEDKEHPPQFGQVNIAIRNGEMIPLHPGNRFFQVKNLVPQGMFPASERFDYIVMPVYFRGEPLGYYFCSPGLRRGNLYESLQAQISGALKNELHIRELKKAEERFSDIAHSTSDWLWEIDAAGVYTFCSDGVEKVLGYKAEEMLGKSFFDNLTESEAYYRKKLLNEVFPAHRPFANLENWNRHKNGFLVGLLTSGTPILKSDGTLLGYRGVIKDVTETKKREEQIKHLAYYDNLTNLPNRTLFYERLQSSVPQAKQDNTKLGLMFLDLDGFKQVNDTYGHDTGDQLLRLVAERIKTCIRSSDTLARIGGDEFTILLATVRSSEDVRLLAERIIRSLAIPLTINDNDIRVTTSLGVAIFPDHATDSGGLVINADKAMYYAKEQGKNQYFFYDAKLLANSKTKPPSRRLFNEEKPAT